MTEKDREGLTLEGWLADPRSAAFTYAPEEPFGVTTRD